MKGRWRKMTCFALSLPNRPGELARFADKLHAEGINLVGLWGYAAGDQPRISCVPESAEGFRHYAKSNDIELEETWAMYLADTDRRGALVETLDKVAAVGINVSAIECVSAGESFGWFLWADDDDLEPLVEVLS